MRIKTVQNHVMLVVAVLMVATLSISLSGTNAATTPVVKQATMVQDKKQNSGLIQLKPGATGQDVELLALDISSGSTPISVHNLQLDLTFPDTLKVSDVKIKSSYGQVLMGPAMPAGSSPTHRLYLIDSVSLKKGTTQKWTLTADVSGIGTIAARASAIRLDACSSSGEQCKPTLYSFSAYNKRGVYTAPSKK